VFDRIRVELFVWLVIRLQVGPIRIRETNLFRLCGAEVAFAVALRAIAMALHMTVWCNVDAAPSRLRR
jgi:hypothetical protein